MNISKCVCNTFMTWILVPKNCPCYRPVYDTSSFWSWKLDALKRLKERRSQVRGMRDLEDKMMLERLKEPRPTSNISQQWQHKSNELKDLKRQVIKRPNLGRQIECNYVRIGACFYCFTQHRKFLLCSFKSLVLNHTVYCYFFNLFFEIFGFLGVWLCDSLSLVVFLILLVSQDHLKATKCIPSLKYHIRNIKFHGVLPVVDRW